MPRKSVGDHHSDEDDASRSPISSEVDAQQSNTGDRGASFHDVDLASTFPTTKVKAQILRDEGVGRISSKAIQLIGACSAIFVREVAEAAVSAAEHENDDDDGQSKDSPSLKLVSSKVKAQGRKRKLSSSNSTKSKPEELDRPSPILLTRDHIKDSIEQDETKFDFLHGVISDNISAKEIPSYGAAYQKKVRREAAGSKRKGKSTTGAIKGKGAGGTGLDNAASAAAVGASSVLTGSATGTAAASDSCAGDEEALRKVIDASLQDGTGMVGLDDVIVEDDEEYD